MIEQLDLFGETPIQVEKIVQPVAEHKRADVPPLDQAGEIYAVLSSLAIGDAVPEQVMVFDYRDGAIPTWIIQEREDAAPGQILTLVDAATRKVNLVSEQTAIAVEVFTFPAKTLCAQPYKWTPGGAKRRDKLADIRQHARQHNDRQVDDGFSYDDDN